MLLRRGVIYQGQIWLNPENQQSLQPLWRHEWNLRAFLIYIMWNFLIKICSLQHLFQPAFAVFNLQHFLVLLTANNFVSAMGIPIIQQAKWIYYHCKDTPASFMQQIPTMMPNSLPWQTWWLDRINILQGNHSMVKGLTTPQTRVKRQEKSANKLTLDLKLQTYYNVILLIYMSKELEIRQP